MTKTNVHNTILSANRVLNLAVKYDKECVRYHDKRIETYNQALSIYKSALDTATNSDHVKTIHNAILWATSRIHELEGKP